VNSIVSWNPKNISVTIITIMSTAKAYRFVRIVPEKRAIAVIGVKFGACGNNRAATPIIIKRMTRALIELLFVLSTMGCILS